MSPVQVNGPIKIRSGFLSKRAVNCAKYLALQNSNRHRLLLYNGSIPYAVFFSNSITNCILHLLHKMDLMVFDRCLATYAIQEVLELQ
jgi:hypothetical protein